MFLQLPFMTSCHALESHETQQDAQDLGPTVLRDAENLKIIHPGHGARCHRTTLMQYCLCSHCSAQNCPESKPSLA